MTEMTVERFMQEHFEKRLGGYIVLVSHYSEEQMQSDLQSLIEAAKQEERERCVAVVEEIWGAHKECDCYGPRDAIIAIQALKEQPPTCGTPKTREQLLGLIDKIKEANTS